MKLKYYLRGAGIGVIVSTLILMIAFGVYQGQTKENTPAETENTSQELTIAEALSEMETDAKSSETETEEPLAASEETEKLLQPETSESVTATADEAETGEAEPEDTIPESGTIEDGAEQVEPAQDTGEGESDGGNAQDTGVAVKKTTVVVRSGDSPMVVSRMLAEAGIVDNADLFYRYLLDHGLNDGIEIGNFSIPEDADYETVAKIITTNEFESRMQR